MAFQPVIMPQIRLIHGVSKQIIDPVSVVGNGARESRRKQNRYDRYSWKFPSRSILQSSKQELHTFFRSVKGSLDSFMMVDPDRPQFVDEPLTSFAFAETWYFETSDGHPIFTGINDMVFYVNGEPAQSSGMFMIVDGRPLVQLQGTLETDTVTFSGTSYVAVRLNSPISWSITAMDPGPNCNPTPSIVDMSDLELIEVFEYA